MTPPTLNWTYPASIVRVIDGDTVVMTVDLGFRVRAEHPVRLVGVDTPEKFRGPPEEREAGRAAQAVTEQWLFEHADPTDPWPFFLVTSKDRRSFNRYLGDVIDRNGESLNAYLVQQGYGADQ